MMRRTGLIVLAALLTAAAPAPTTEMAARTLAPRVRLSEAVRSFVQVDAPVIVLRPVRVIDGTGAPATADRTPVIEKGRSVAIGGPDLTAPMSAAVIDLTARSVMPGIFGMHDHMYYFA